MHADVYIASILLSHLSRLLHACNLVQILMWSQYRTFVLYQLCTHVDVHAARHTCKKSTYSAAVLTKKPRLQIGHP